MSETETTVPMDDKALFNSAVSDAAPETPVAAEPAAVTEQPSDGPSRDEHGRFAPKEQPAEVKADAQSQPQEAAAHVPAWRLNEVSEARRAAETRAAENERRAHDAEMEARRYQAQLRHLTEKPQEPVDPYADPEKFRDTGIRQHIDPLAQRMSAIGEYYSRKSAIATHGVETVQEAYKWLDQGSRAGDPRFGPVIQRAMNSIDPFEEIVTAYKRDRALSTVGDDPNAWFEKEFARRAAEDPQFAAKLKTVPVQQNGAAQQQSVVKLPPSLTRAPGSAAASTNGGMDNESLYAFATR